MDWPHIVRQFGLNPTGVQSCAPGFSGAKVWRLETPAGDFALKVYPTGEIDAARLSWVHQLLQEAADADLPTPRPAGILVEGHELWDLVSWQPGTALLATEATPARCFAAGRALARLHHVWRRHGAVGPAPVFARRLGVLQEFRALGLEPRVLPELWNEARRAVADQWPELVASLEKWRDRPRRVQPCLGDLWHAHILFVDDEVSGLIDHAATRVDYPLVDVARLLGSLDLSPALTSSFFDGYVSVQKLSAEDWKLYTLLEAASVIGSLAGWLVRLARESIDTTQCNAIEARIRDILQRARRR